MFKQPGDLEPPYDEIIRTAIFTVKPDNIATFLGQRITYNCKKEVGTNYNQRILETKSGAQGRQFIETKGPIEKKHLQPLPTVHDYESSKLPIPGIHLIL